MAMMKFTDSFGKQRNGILTVSLQCLACGGERGMKTTVIDREVVLIFETPGFPKQNPLKYFHLLIPLKFEAETV